MKNTGKFYILMIDNNFKCIYHIVSYRTNILEHGKDAWQL